MRIRKRALKTTWRETWPIWLIFAALFGFGAFGVWVLLPAAQAPTKALLQGEDMTINVGELQPNVPRLFAYPLQPGHTTEFFIEREANDKITVAFASCRRCYRDGHYRQGEQILCGRCNEPMVRLGPGQAPGTEKDCAQIPIPFERSGGLLTVRASAVGDTFTRWYASLGSQDTTSANRDHQ